MIPVSTGRRHWPSRARKVSAILCGQSVLSHSPSRLSNRFQFAARVKASAMWCALTSTSRGASTVRPSETATGTIAGRTTMLPR